MDEDARQVSISAIDVDQRKARNLNVLTKYLKRQYGFFRPYVQQGICRYLDCGDLHNEFGRVQCRECGHEYLLAFSCKRRHLCPSFHQKRVVEFGEWLCRELVKAVPHQHFVFSIPKILRRCFLCDRKLLSELSRCVWESLEVFFQETVPEEDAVFGAVIAIQTFGDFLGFNPHFTMNCAFIPKKAVLSI